METYNAGNALGLGRGDWHYRGAVVDLPVLHPPGRQRCCPVLCLRAFAAMVACRNVDGGHDVQRRHAEFRNQPGPRTWCGAKLDVVGLSDYGHADSVLLCSPLATFGRTDGSGVLRNPLLGQVGGGRSWVSGTLPGPFFQLCGDGNRYPGSRQDRQHHAGLARLADNPLVLNNIRGPHSLSGALGGGRNGPSPVLHCDDGRFRRGLLRGE